MTNKKLEEKKRKYLKKKIAGIIANPDVENRRKFYQYIGILNRILPKGFNAPKRLNPNRYKNHYEKGGSKNKRKEAKDRILDEIFKRKELV